nr:hypothetical protein BaRGS_009434 [Batillaria attramentaria]
MNMRATPGEQERTLSKLLSLVDNLGERESAPVERHVPRNDGIPDGSQHIVLLIGKTGNGRSSVGNTLLGRDDRQDGSIEEELKGSIPQELKNVLGDAGHRYVVFNNRAKPDDNKEAVNKLADIVWTIPRAHTPERKLSDIKHADMKKVVDTPDISDNDHFMDKQRKEQLSLWKRLAAPGPHAILLTVRCDVRYTAEEYDIYKQLKTLWGDSASFCKRLIVAFTFGDRQDADIEEELKSSVPVELKNVLKDANGRYVVFNNRAGPEEKCKTGEIEGG